MYLDLFYGLLALSLLQLHRILATPVTREHINEGRDVPIPDRPGPTYESLVSTGLREARRYFPRAEILSVTAMTTDHGLQCHDSRQCRALLMTVNTPGVNSWWNTFNEPSDQNAWTIPTRATDPPPPLRALSGWEPSPDYGTLRWAFARVRSAGYKEGFEHINQGFSLFTPDRMKYEFVDHSPAHLVVEVDALSGEVTDRILPPLVGNGTETGQMSYSDPLNFRRPLGQSENGTVEI